MFLLYCIVLYYTTEKPVSVIFYSLINRRFIAYRSDWWNSQLYAHAEGVSSIHMLHILRHGANINEMKMKNKNKNWIELNWTEWAFVLHDHKLTTFQQKAKVIANVFWNCQRNSNHYVVCAQYLVFLCSLEKSEKKTWTKFLKLKMVLQNKNWRIH